MAPSEADERGTHVEDLASVAALLLMAGSVVLASAVIVGLLIVGRLDPIGAGRTPDQRSSPQPSFVQDAGPQSEPSADADSPDPEPPDAGDVSSEGGVTP